ncbi:hypothetical protein JCM8547_007692 [Rhodosporidiobolus lusitaniae]
MPPPSADKIPSKADETEGRCIVCGAKTTHGAERVKKRDSTCFSARGASEVVHKPVCGKSSTIFRFASLSSSELARAKQYAFVQSPKEDGSRISIASELRRIVGCSSGRAPAVLDSLQEGRPDPFSPKQHTEALRSIRMLVSHHVMVNSYPGRTSPPDLWDLTDELSDPTLASGVRAYNFAAFLKEEAPGFDAWQLDPYWFIQVQHFSTVWSTLIDVRTKEERANGKPGHRRGHTAKGHDYFAFVRLLLLRMEEPLRMATEQDSRINSSKVTEILTYGSTVISIAGQSEDMMERLFARMAF